MENGKVFPTPCEDGSALPDQDALLNPVTGFSPTAPREGNGSPTRAQSPSDNQKFFNMSQPPLANRELVLELKAGKTLRPTYQSTGLTTVFSGSGKSNRRLSSERKRNTETSPPGLPQPLACSSCNGEPEQKKP
ncbi:espin-like [Latimeria chalumnae]|uniref:espin-like n=1 Tax=Latimeria chalumnae TaxID=7897 RepID=UPI0003C16F31|nr:PREDICTED: espin-like [Latimeria chalumnae]XP_014346136.1 PREDICTED: espin-like [Latimeria chalumnae]XP_014346137.1 PREDICTED: espin-like [Latimeria chalumnae]XP_014346138.1 PREDICTED: espin-like [Latimeria chalumnae]XP_014346139.1 PREDICTED: espin-like [Latimeria chalumnae]|eukprot:XP_005999826.1 PREDICTED: espin-like [Latimeria chalumnae]